MHNAGKDLVNPILQALIENTSMPEVLLAMCDICLNKALIAEKAGSKPVATAWTNYARSLFELAQQAPLPGLLAHLFIKRPGPA